MPQRRVWTGSPWSTDYRREDKKSLRVMRWRCFDQIDIDSLSQKTPIITTKKGEKTINCSERRCGSRSQPKMQYCQNVQKIVEFQLFTSLWNRYRHWLFDIELIDKCFCSDSHSRIHLCFTAGKRIGIWNCHATWRHRKMTISNSPYL